MSEFLVIPRPAHDQLVSLAYQARGFTAAESAEGAKLAAEAARHGIRTHHALKALHLDHLFGSAAGGCVPGAEIEVLPSRFPASERWNANKKLGQSVAYRAINRAIELADQFGIAQIAVDNATLGTGKTADGLDALRWWQEHKKTGDFAPLRKIAEYCAYDVKVTKCVHEYALQHGLLKYDDRNGRIAEIAVAWA